MCQQLGLRYAPEIRFYRDNTLEQIRDQRQQARQYLREVDQAKREEEANDPRVQMQTTYDNLQELKSLEPQAIRQLQAGFKDDNNARGLELLEVLKNKEELKEIEDDLKYKLDNNISEEPAGGVASQAEAEPRTRRDKREATKHK